MERAGWRGLGGEVCWIVLCCAAPSGRTLTPVHPRRNGRGQRWAYNASSGYITLQESDGSYCLDISGYASAPQTAVQGYGCHPGDTDPTHANQVWGFNASSKQIVATGEAKGMVLDVSNYGASGPGSQVWLYTSTDTPNQQWKYDPTTG